MKEQLILDNWTFFPGRPSRFAAPEKIAVELPHDMQIGLPQTPEATSASGYFPGCVGTYERLLDIPQEWEGERVFLAFDGVYMHATVSLNGSRIDFHPYGYSPFCVEITRRVLFGRPNRLEVVADSSEAPNCRWYAGAGIYRDVKLLHGPLVRIQHRGIFLQTESIDGDTATVTAQVQVVNDTALPFHGHVDLTLAGPDGEETRARTSLWVEPGEEALARLRFVVERPRCGIWTPPLSTRPRPR